MRKILLVLFGCLVAFSVESKEPEEFVNPLFYKGMINHSKEPNFVKITPTSYYIENCYGYRTSAQCEMLENTENTVTLKCLHLPEDKNDDKALIIVGYDHEPQVWTYKFVIREKNIQTSNEGTYVRKMSYYKNEKEPSSYWGFLIYNSEEKLQEDWTDILNTFKKEPEEFVNPLFYKGMINHSKEPNFVKITPTSYYIENCYGYRTSAQCEMLENTENTVTLKCLHLPEDKNDDKALIIVGYDHEPQVWTYKFVIRDKNIQTSDEGTYVRVYEYPRNEKEWSSYMGGIVYNSEEKLQENWADILDTFKKKTEEFVNPLFYKNMISLLKEIELVEITPTSYYTENGNGQKSESPCEMLENKKDTVTLMCLHLPEDKKDNKEPQVIRYKFVMYPPKDPLKENISLVRVWRFYGHKKEPTDDKSYLIYDSEEQLIKSWEEFLNTFKDESVEAETHN